MTKSSGVHLKWHEVKAGIIKFIISSKGAVREPDIRERLRKDYDIVDQGNIKTHLRDLQHRFHCIEKIPPKKPGNANEWEIRRIEHVKNIRYNFPEIQIKTYEKALKIVSKRFFTLYPDSLMASKFRIQLILSDSFFDTFVHTDPETVYDIAYEFYKDGFDKWGKEYPEWEQRVLEDMFIGGAVGRFTEMMNKVSSGLNTLKEAGISKIEILNAETLKTKFETAIKKIKDEDSELMDKYYQWDKSGEAFEMKLPLLISSVLIETMFEFCFKTDIYNGTVSPEEKEFVNKTKEMRAYYKANQEISLLSELQAYDDFYIQCFEKLKAKTETL